jgi:hypothetical protein
MNLTRKALARETESLRVAIARARSASADGTALAAGIYRHGDGFAFERVPYQPSDTYVTVVRGTDTIAGAAMDAALLTYAATVSVEKAAALAVAFRKRYARARLDTLRAARSDAMDSMYNHPRESVYFLEKLLELVAINEALRGR